MQEYRIHQHGRIYTVQGIEYATFGRIYTVQDYKYTNTVQDIHAGVEYVIVGGYIHGAGIEYANTVQDYRIHQHGAYTRCGL